MLEMNKEEKRARWGWYLYDFGNSAYAAVILLAVYSVYFEGQVVQDELAGPRLWGQAVGIAMLTVALISPVLGAIADFSAAKKRFLLFFTTLCILFTCLLFFIQPGYVALGMIFFILAEIGYRSSQVFYNGLLPEVASDAEMPKVSGTGWAIGSSGGVVCLLIVLPLIVVIGGTFVVRLSFIITGVFFAIAASFLFRNLTEKGEPHTLPAGTNIVTVGFQRLATTFKKARHYSEFLKFMLSFIVYHDGVMMILNFAAIIGAILFGMDQTGLIILIIIVQITNALGAYLFGMMAERYDCKRALLLSIGMLSIVVLWLIMTQSVTLFFVIGAIAGFAMGGIQSVSRTMVGRLSPSGQSAEFFGLFAVAGRSSSFIGPLVYGSLATWVARRAELLGSAVELAAQTGQRTALWSIIAFLIIGSLLLLSVDEKKGIVMAGRVD